MRSRRSAVQHPALGVWEPVPIVQIPPPSWEVGGPEKASQKGELFESSVIQKRPFNVRTRGARRKCRRHRSKLLKQSGFTSSGGCFWNSNSPQKRLGVTIGRWKRGVGTERSGLGEFHVSAATSKVVNISCVRVCRRVHMLLRTSDLLVRPLVYAAGRCTRVSSSGFALFCSQERETRVENAFSSGSTGTFRLILG